MSWTIQESIKSETIACLLEDIKQICRRKADKREVQIQLERVLVGNAMVDVVSDWQASVNYTNTILYHLHTVAKILFCWEAL